MDSNEDNDSSFELFEAMPTPSVLNETSMSIVVIPDDNPSVADVKRLETSQMSDMSKIFQTSNNSGNDLDTKLMQSSNGLTKSQHLSSEDMNNLDKQQKEERVKSLDSMKRSNSNSRSDSTFSSELELYLKELRDDNEKLRNVLERNNGVMKQQLKSLHEWQCAMNVAKQEQIESNEQSRRVIDTLEQQNFELSERVKELEGMAGLRLVEELGVEVASLRSQMDEKNKYQMINEGLQTDNNELTSKLMESTQVIASMSHEITSLNNLLNEANVKLDSLPIMKSQLEIYERDFKMEEISKLAALKEVEALEREIDNLKLVKREMEEKLERGQPSIDVAQDNTSSKSYTCPKCWFSFKTFQAIQNHIQRCVDHDELFI